MRVLTAVLDLLFPPRCPACTVRTRVVDLCPPCRERVPRAATPWCTICGLPYAGAGVDHPCPACTRRRPHFACARARTVYGPGQENPAIDLLHRLKYGRDPTLAPILAGLLVDRLPLPLDHDVIVPVPLHRARLRWRGFNQAVPLARAVARACGRRVAPRVLARRRPTPPQVGLPAAERRANVRHAFALREPEVVDGRVVLLVDDVMTTGATLDECARILVRGGARRVDALVLARALDPA